ncbi:MAG: TrkA C-terminal domain-containing protein [Candidatus Bathyarchaeia archaeon]|nr:potassium channel protein [Candidatus Bathyarchaeota archaeon]
MEHKPDMHNLEKIEYQPVSIREIVLEMKNLSELMIDLAYSAALFNDKELAEDVIELEKRIDRLALLLEIHIMVAARNPDDAEDLLAVSRIGSAADKISDAAADIAAIVVQNIGVHPIVTEIFENVEERLIRAKVTKDSLIIGKRIRELDLAAKMGVDILAIGRNKDWIINPEDYEVIKENDILIVRGSSLGTKRFKEITEKGQNGGVK